MQAEKALLYAAARELVYRLFLGSSAVEHPTVNRMVAGSNPARGASKIKYLTQVAITGRIIKVTAVVTVRTLDVRSVSHARKREKTVTIRRLLKASRLAGLQEVEQRLNRAYRDVLRSLHLVDRNDPIAEIVAKTVIEIGATGVRGPSEISKIALKRLAQLGRPRLEAPTSQEIFANF